MHKIERVKFGVVGVVLGVASLLVVHSVAAQTTTMPSGSCPVPPFISVGTGAVLQGVVPLNLGVTSVATSFAINRVVFMLDGKPMGEGRQASTTTQYWTMPWATQVTDSGPHSINATIYYNGSSVCATTPIQLTTQNPPSFVSSNLDIQALPPQWSGPTNTTIDITTQLALTSGELAPPELMQSAYYEWSTDIGSVAPTKGVARFSSGGTAGNGRVRVKASYAGRSAQFDVPINVVSQLAPTPIPTPTPTSTSGGSGSNTSGSGSSGGSGRQTTNQTGTSQPTPTPEPRTLTPLTQEQKIAQITSQLDAQPTVLSCASLNLTQARLDTLRSEARRLTSSEFATIRGCFAETNFVVPSAYVPVAPESVKSTEVSESTDARINDAATQSEKAPDTGVERVKLRLQGQATPNSDVLLYVFSEPLVLYAKADDKGNWVYDLVDPLTPGQHEAYAVVETTTGTYKKSSPFSFIVETAQASAENPNGYSLSIKTVSSLATPPSKQRANLYVFASIGVVLFVTAVGALLLIRTLRHVPPEPTDPSTDV